MAKPLTYVPPCGDIEKCEIAFVGDMPDRTDVQYRKPFSGNAGRVLNDCMRSAGINPSSCYFTNVIKDRDHKPSYYIEFSRNGVCLSAAAEYYAELLIDELKRCKAKIIIALGEAPLYLLTKRNSIFKWRGSILESPDFPGKYIIPIIHPYFAALPKGNYLNQHLITFDLKKALRVLEQGNVNNKRNIIISPTYIESMEYLVKAEYEALHNYATIAYDIEIYNLEVSCISFAYRDDEAISIPFIWHNGDYFSIEQEGKLFKKIGEILENPKIVKVGQNLSFDAHFMLRKYGIAPQNLDDTMIAQQILMPDYNKGLDFITSIWTDHPYYKDEGKQWFKRGGAWENLWHYNATDSIICAEAFPKQTKELMRTENVKTYVRQKSLIQPLVFMQEHGIRCDVPGMIAEQVKQEAKIEGLQEELNQLAGHELNPNSPKQLKDYFYNEKKQKPYVFQGKVCVNELALKRLSRKGFEEAKLIIKMRKIKKLCANYLDPEKVDKDGRYRCSYNPVGTRYSRISSSKSIFGTGGNLQNWPHEMQKFLLPDINHVFYSFDLSQAENRIVAYVGRIKEMIDAFENGIDVHSLTASLIFNCPYEQVREDEANGVLCALGDGKRGKRFWGKKCIAAGTEILTPDGWVNIEDWNWKNKEIAQWNKDSRTISFTYATNMSCYESNVIELSGRNAHLIATPNHRVPIYRKDKDVFKVEELDELPNDSHYGIPTCGFFYSDKSILTPDEVRLMVAFQADGSFNGKSHRFKFIKARKISRIRSILKSLSLKFNESIQSDGSTLFGFKGPYYLTKDFDSFLLTMSLDNMKVFMEEVVLWDGYSGDTRNQYFTTNKNNAEWVQTIAHLCGYTAVFKECQPTGFGKKLLYHVLFNNRNNYATLKSLKKREIKETTMVFGPEVPSSFFMIRSNGIISVTGNSNHGLNYDLGYKNFALRYEIPERDGKFIVDRYHAAYPNLRNGFHKYVQNSLRKNRTLENLMGRRTLFLDKWGDALFKEAYSCIPQGTVGDIITEYGVGEIYYNQNQYGPISLMNQVHDSVGFQISLDVPWIEHARMIDSIKRSLEATLKTPFGREFVVPADLTIGTSLYKGDGVELKAPQWPGDLETLSHKLKELYESLL